jgi:hypothetical protein
MRGLGAGDVRTPEAKMEKFSAQMGETVSEAQQARDIWMIGTGKEWGDLMDGGDDVDEQQYIPVIVWAWVKARGTSAEEVTGQVKFDQSVVGHESVRLARLLDQQVAEFQVSSMIAQPKWRAVALQWLATFALGVNDWDLKEPWYGGPGTQWGAHITRGAMKVVAQRLEVPVRWDQRARSPRAGPERRVSWGENLPDGLYEKHKQGEAVRSQLDVPSDPQANVMGYNDAATIDFETASNQSHSRDRASPAVASQPAKSDESPS